MSRPRNLLARVTMVDGTTWTLRRPRADAVLLAARGELAGRLGVKAVSLVVDPTTGDIRDTEGTTLAAVKWVR